MIDLLGGLWWLIYAFCQNFVFGGSGVGLGDEARWAKKRTVDGDGLLRGGGEVGGLVLAELHLTLARHLVLVWLVVYGVGDG